VGIHITNDVPLKSITIPLVIRGWSSEGPASVQLTFSQRLSGSALADVRTTNLYFTADGSCQSAGSAGFGTADFADTLTHPVPVVPLGVLFHAATLGTDYLPIGADTDDPNNWYSDGSLYLTMTFNSLWTYLDIDTTCTDPSNHLLFIDASDQAIVPQFSTGYGIIDYFCTNHGDLDQDQFMTAIDLGMEIDYLFAGRSLQSAPFCEGLVDPGDFNCDGWPDAIDLAGYIDHLFAGGPGPCNPTNDCAPCACGHLP